MFIDTHELVEIAIGNLEALSEALRDEASETSHDSETLTPEARSAKEASLSIQILLPKLRTIRQVHAAKSPRCRCANCDEF